MAEEIFDIVDEQDRVIGQAPRAHVHANRLRHRAVHILVRDPAGHTYLQRRSMMKDNHPGLWDSSCSGHVNSGEEYADAALRELGEELGVRTSGPLRLILSLPASDETGQEFIRVYTFRHYGAIYPNPAEITGGRWLATGGIDRWIARDPHEFSPVFRLVWRLVHP